MTDLSNDPAYRLASALQALEDARAEYGEVKREHKDRIERLMNEVATLKREILTGQKRLPLDAPIASAIVNLPDFTPEQAKTAVEKIKKVVRQ